MRPNRLKNFKDWLESFSTCSARTCLDLTDLGFVALRLVVLLGGAGWVLFSDLPPVLVREMAWLLLYFAAYGLLLTLLLYLFPQRKRVFYLISLFLDLAFVSLLVHISGGYQSPFTNGFYLMTALYSFYYGVLIGLGVALLSTLLYFVSEGIDFSILHWTDFSVRAAFLFLLAVPIGMFSQKLQRDKETISKINRDLEDSLASIKALQDRLVEAEKLAAIGRLTADVAHEIRNPLTSIGGFARRLHKQLADDSAEKESAGVIVAEVDRLESILKDLLTFSRETRFNLELRRVNNAVRKAITLWLEPCDQQGVKIREDLDSDIPRVLCDRDQVRQAVDNLINNALAAMPEGGELRLSTGMERLYQVDYVVIMVSDSGHGIPADKLEMIFEAFYSTKKIGVGTGLGLSICKKIMEEHNGLILAESALGQGSTFKLYFPYQPPAEADKMPCWEFHQCGVKKTEGAAQFRCAAYPHYGRICWAVAGTFCGKKISGSIAQKLGDCEECEFYRKVVIDKEL
ncbi:two-component system sensor histidine kinase NtrB [Desulfurivibrio dismutans]|uniref:two-component system sensor histidine kinase NtrB n=1 Tax=Desulfurivibrio dismutans TaxID=1398908 RepID=UPI0023DAA0B2|nr:ATP-binding protein [Desulfurivibrio alkaliphilus]MDF1614957.1 ATP-binding protein [Desulfurivibrio alkaliphilus]